MLEKFNPLRRKITGAILAAAPALASGAVARDLYLESQQISQERAQLATQAELIRNNQNLNSLRTQFAEQFRINDPNIPSWTLLQSLALLNSVHFARNQFFVTPEESERSIQVINRSGQLAIDRTQSVFVNQQFFKQSNDNLSKSVGALVANGAVTAAFYARNTEQKKQVRRKGHPKDVNRRDFLKYGLAAASIATAPMAIAGSILQPHYERTDNLYEGIPTHALKALQHGSNTEALNEYMNGLAVPSFEELTEIPEYAYVAITNDIRANYQKDYDNPELSIKDREALSQRIYHAQLSDYSSYASRVQAIRNYTSVALPLMISQPPDNPMITTKEMYDTDESVFNVGIGLILDDRLQKIQQTHHDISSVDLNVFPITPATPAPPPPSIPQNSL
jgi:hypothetical protein